MSGTRKWLIPTLFVVVMTAGMASPASAQVKLSNADKKTVSDFEARLKQYVERREALRKTLPPLPKDATAEPLQALKSSLQKLVIADRVNAKAGDSYATDRSFCLRNDREGIQRLGADRAAQTVLEADTKACR